MFSEFIFNSLHSGKDSSINSAGFLKSLLLSFSVEYVPVCAKSALSK